MKNGLSRAEQRTVSKTQNNRLTGKAPYKSVANRFLPQGAALLCADLRDFTALSEATEPAAMIIQQTES
jgi:class 3 adenylate cyclase